MDSDGVGRVELLLKRFRSSMNRFGYVAFERASGLVVYTYYPGFDHA